MLCMAPLPQNSNSYLTSGRLLARNALWSLLGNSAPMIVAFFCIPILIRGLGKERFGVLALAWALIGYASLFYLGLGRALTQLVAQKLGIGNDRDIPALVWTSLLLMLLLGLVGAAVIVVLSPWLVHRALNIPGALQRETLQSFYLLGLSIPFVIGTAGLRGLLEAYQCFGSISALRVPMGVFTFAGPLLAMPFSKSLYPVVAVLVAGRLIAWVAHLLLCLRVMPALRERIAWQRAVVGPLLRFGGWMTVSNIVSPLMVTLDRFLIGALLSVAAVANYATPFEVVTKLLLVPGALVGVMFPAFSTTLAQDRCRTAFLYGRSVKFVLIALFPVTLLIVLFARDALRLWLGIEFAQNSTHALQWLAVGVFINSLAYVPFALLQGAGRPSLTAKLHLIELLPYLLTVWGLTLARGIEGTAMAWTLRVTVDALVLFLLSARVLSGWESNVRRIGLVMSAALLTPGIANALPSPGTRVASLFLLLAGFAILAWRHVLDPTERLLAQTQLKASLLLLRREE
jgi:O-antigen/teichoic acid export membrane protein